MKTRRDKIRGVLAAALIVLSAAMAAFGAWRGERAIVQNKAANICFECIGLG